MSEDPALRTKLTQEWDVRGIDVATLQLDRKGTLQPMHAAPKSASAPLAGRRTGVTQLPELSVGPDAEIEMGDTIGEGGMGIVWAARQTPLRREVAVKSVQPDAPQPHTTLALLREARITGTLEHPNVVPIHALGRDKDARPLIIMKRIEGTSWADLLAEQSRNGPGAVMSHLEYHVGVLIDVAKAVHFAHSRGILHRDIKPDNVMIGGFGEVYVVDWGIAVGLRETDLELPLARDVREVTGSPAYLAPEMAIGDGPSIDERSDVYLLGATLHEIITGLPPHAAPNTMAMLTNAYASAPYPYDSSVPTGVAEICHTAMSRERTDRYPTAAAFAAALQRFLKHRDSMLLSDESRAKLAALRECVERTPDKAALYNLFNECRFGFTHALRIWDSNTLAREQLQLALELMIHYELEHGSAGAAAALLGEMPIASAALARRVERKRSAEHEASSELDRLKRERDPTAVDRPRAYLSLLVAVTWPLLHVLIYFLGRHTAFRMGHREFAVGYGLFAVGSMVIGLAARETFLTRTRSGLPTQLTVTLCHAAVALSWLICAPLGLELEASYAVALFVGSAMWTTGAVAVDCRLLAWGLAMVGGLVASLIRPDLGLLWIGAAGTVASVVLGWLRLRTTRGGEPVPLSQQLSQLMASRAGSS